VLIDGAVLFNQQSAVNNQQFQAHSMRSVLVSEYFEQALQFFFGPEINFDLPAFALPLDPHSCAQRESESLLCGARVHVLFDWGFRCRRLGHLLDERFRFTH
jgi:hypothetical protein